MPIPMGMEKQLKAPTHRLVGVEAAAEHLGVTERMIRRLVAQRRLRYYRIGRHIRFAVSDLEAFIAAGAVEADPQPRTTARDGQTERQRAIQHATDGAGSRSGTG